MSSLTRRTFLPAAAAAPFAPALQAARRAASRPNIVYILADDLGYGDLSCYGQKRFTTPNIDRLAAEGMRFIEHYAGTTVCAPSRAAFLEGRHTGHCSVRGNQPPHLLDPERTTLAEALKKAGYTTAIIGKWGLGHPPPPDDPQRHGFDHAFGYINMWHAHNCFPEFLYRNGVKVPLKGNVLDRSLPLGELPEGTGVSKNKVTYAPDVIAREALAYLDRDHDRPFFLFLTPNLPHENGEAFKVHGNGNEVPGYGRFADLDWPAPDKGFARMMQYVDDLAGQVAAKLRARGLDQNTIVAFGSDNGPHIGSGRSLEFFDCNGPFRGHKRDLYEGGIRVPLVVRWPGRVKPGTVSGQVNAMWDLFPTFCEAAGAPVPEDLDGISFLPTLLGRGSQKQHDYLYWEFHEQGGSQAVRQGKWNAVRSKINRGAPGVFELFDLEADPGESRDLARTYPEIVRRLGELMAQAHRPHPVLSFSNK